MNCGIVPCFINGTREVLKSGLLSLSAISFYACTALGELELSVCRRTVEAEELCFRERRVGGQFHP